MGSSFFFESKAYSIIQVPDLPEDTAFQVHQDHRVLCADGYDSACWMWSLYFRVWILYTNYTHSWSVPAANSAYNCNHICSSQDSSKKKKKDKRTVAYFADASPSCIAGQHFQLLPHGAILYSFLNSTVCFYCSIFKPISNEFLYSDFSEIA